MKKLVCSLLLLFFCGCITQSINPFHTKEVEIKAPKEILGDWKVVKLQGDDIAAGKVQDWKFSENKILVHDKKGNASELEVKYFRVNDDILASVFPGEPNQKTNAYWIMNVMPVFTCCKVEVDKNKLSLYPMNLEFLQDLINNKKASLPYVQSQSRDFILFALTPLQWVAFIAKYQTHSLLFDRKTSFVFEK